MAKELEKHLHDVEFFDLQDNRLPMSDGDECYDLPEVLDFREKVKNAQGIIMAIPIYNYNISSGAKNAVELGGRMLYDKIFGFICAEGGKSSYMSVMSLANSLMIDFRCYIIPKFVYATKHHFDGKKISEYFNDIIDNGFSVREVEQIAKDFSDRNYNYSAKRKKIDSDDIIPFGHQKKLFDLSKSLNVEIKLKRNKKGSGKIIIPFSDDDKLSEIF